MLSIALPGQRYLLSQVVRFSQVLHARGVPVNSANLIDFCECLSLIDIGNRTDFYTAARATLVSSQTELAVFERVFEEFWSSRDEREQQEMAEEDTCDETAADPAAGQRRDRLNPSDQEQRDEQQDNQDDASVQTYSPWSLLMRKDFESMSEQEVEQARVILKDLVELLANENSRRRVTSRHGKEINPRQMLRQHATYGADNTELLYRERRIRKTRLLLLCDVSGSMERYSRFLIQFIYAMRQQLTSLDVAVFSTKMTVITDLLSAQSVDQSLREVGRVVHDWNGGTNIGHSLGEFNEWFARALDQRRSVVVILSDGWDRGDAHIMRREMEYLYRRTKKLIWLNPLMSNSGYQPLCRGMQSALPFIDHLLSAHDLESLTNLIKLLRATLRN